MKELEHKTKEHMGDSGALRKQRLLEAALILFAEQGYHGVAVPKIAREAGISTGSVYNYFSSKDELVNELFWIWKEKLKIHVQEAYPVTAPTRSQFDYIWERLHNYAETYPKAFQFIEGHLHSSYLSIRCKELESEVYEIGRRFIQQGQLSGAIQKADPQILVALFFGVFVQFFKDCNAGRLVWNHSNSLSLRDLCWKAMSLSC